MKSPPVSGATASDQPSRKRSRLAGLRVALTYLVAGVVWILASDFVLHLAVSNLEWMSLIQTLKGWLFVILSSILIFFLANREHRIVQEQELEKKRIFRKTVDGSLHILLNYLNQSRILWIEAENHQGFDKTVMEECETAMQQTKKELINLSHLEIIDPKSIESFVYRDSRRAGDFGKPETS